MLSNELGQGTRARRAHVCLLNDLIIVPQALEADEGVCFTRADGRTAVVPKMVAATDCGIARSEE